VLQGERRHASSPAGHTGATTFCVPLSYKETMEILDVISSSLKRKMTIQSVISAKFQSQHLRWYGLC
ncbi:hypothetical protein ATANTOWER_025864, partial [Ataeniobius toweri]|nr:hypothetical protein [Ataeniobius toweri]